MRLTLNLKLGLVKSPYRFQQNGVFNRNIYLSTQVLNRTAISCSTAASPYNAAAFGM